MPNGYLGGSVLLKEVRKVIEKSILAKARYSGCEEQNNRESRFKAFHSARYNTD